MRNPVTRRAHRVQFFWQILFPLLAGIVLMGAGLLWLLNSNAGSVERTAQVATIIFALPLLLLGIIFFAITALLTFGVGRVIKWLPPQTYRVQRGAQGVSARIVGAVDAMLTPLLAIESWLGAANALFRRRR